MIYSTRVRLVLGALALAMLSFAGCLRITQKAHDVLAPLTWTAAYRQGRSEAKLDLMAGHLRYRMCVPTDWDDPDNYAQHLLNDYNIELVNVAGCGVNDDIFNRTRGYNETALPVIEARYGNGVLDRVRKQAVDEWNQTHPSR